MAIIINFLLERQHPSECTFLRKKKFQIHVRLCQHCCVKERSFAFYNLVISQSSHKLYHSSVQQVLSNESFDVLLTLLWGWGLF